MGRVSGRVSLATRRIWGEPDDEPDLCAITSVDSEFNNNEYIPGVSTRIICDKNNNNDVRDTTTNNHSGQTTEKLRESPITRSKINPSLNEKHNKSSENLIEPNETSTTPPLSSITSNTISKRSGETCPKIGDRSLHTPNSSSVVHPPLSCNNVLEKESILCNGTKLTWEHRETTKILQDLDEPIEIFSQCSKEEIEERKVSVGMTGTEFEFSAPDISINQKHEGIVVESSCSNECLSEKVSKSIIEMDDSPLMDKESKDLDSKRLDFDSSGGKLHLNKDISEFNSDSTIEISPSNFNSAENYDMRISNYVDNKVSQTSSDDNFKIRATIDSSSDNTLNLNSTDKEGANETFDVVEPCFVKISSKDLIDGNSAAGALHNLKILGDIDHIGDMPEIETCALTFPSNDNVNLGTALPDLNHLDSVDKARESVNFNEKELPSISDIEYTNESSSQPINLDTEYDVTNDESNETDLVQLGLDEFHVENADYKYANGDVHEVNTSITVFDNLYNKLRASDAKVSKPFDDSRDYPSEDKLLVPSRGNELQSLKDDENDQSFGNGQELQENSIGASVANVIGQDIVKDKSIAYGNRVSEDKNEVNDLSNGVEQSHKPDELGHPTSEDRVLEDESVITTLNKGVEQSQKPDVVDDTATEDKSPEDKFNSNDSDRNRQKHKGNDDIESKIREVIEEKFKERVKAHASIVGDSTLKNKNHENDRITSDIDVAQDASKNKVKIENLFNTDSISPNTTMPRDKYFGNEVKKFDVESAEHSETETKTSNHRKTWLKYVKSFERGHYEGDADTVKTASSRETNRQLEKENHNQIAASAPKLPETPMKKKYNPSHSGSITPDNTKKGFRQKIKKRISDTLHKLKD